MSHELNDWAPPVNHARAKAEVYQRVRLRLRSLKDIHKLAQQHSKPEDVLCISPEELRRLERQRFPCSSRLDSMKDAQVAREAVAARKWLLTVLGCQNKAMLRDQEMRMIKLAVGKQVNGRQGDWTEKERLYMALTDYKLSSSEHRLRAGFMVTLHRNLAERLQDVSRLFAVHNDRLQRRSDDDAGFLNTLAAIADKAVSITVDHFACTIPLAQLTATANDTAIVDDNAGCCPVCQNRYTALSEFGIDELLADYPVRIKHCGHVVGKSCLEQWMMTPKIEEAKYPHRTCPLCRVKVEGVKSPETPRGLRQHLKDDRRAMEALHELIYGFGVELEDCISAVVGCMSEEIACTELLAEVTRSGGDKKRYEVLKDKLEDLRKEKRVWGFRGDGVWVTLRGEWMDSGVGRRA